MVSSVSTALVGHEWYTHAHHSAANSALQHPGPRKVIGEEAGYLGEVEYEDEIEEQFQRGSPRLDGVLVSSLRRLRPGRAHPAPPSGFLGYILSLQEAR